MKMTVNESVFYNDQVWIFLDLLFHLGVRICNLKLLAEFYRERKLQREKTETRRGNVQSMAVTR